MTNKGEKHSHPGRQNILSPDGETKAGFSPINVLRVETFIAYATMDTYCNKTFLL